jgi:hypothetical protein
MSYIETLIERCKKAQAAKPAEEFELDISDLSPLENIERAIYIIEEIDGNPNATFIQLSNYKQTGQRACPRLNAPSVVMYVGSSTTDLKKRITEHLGFGSKSTYALNLSHWFHGQYKITIRVYKESPDVLQIIEDSLSHELSPAFGKRGANNK